MGRVKEETEAGQKTTLLDYDLRGRLALCTLPSGVQITSVYDGLGRLLEQYSSDKAIHDQYVYERGPNPTQIIDHIQNTTLLRNYNLFGEIVKEMNPNGLQMSWSYDSIGRCTSTILPDGSSIDYPSTGAHLQAVQRRAPNGHLLYEHRYHQFDPNGHVAEEQLIFNLGSIHTTHDLLERPSSQSSPWLEHAIAYGPSGLIAHTTNSLFGGKAYAHDALNQMIKDGEQTHLFDSLGNSATHNVNDLNQIISTQNCNFVYDANGNPRERISAQQRITYAFDPRGRLIEITIPDQKKTCYYYDPLSRLFAKETYRHMEDHWEKERKISFLYDRDIEIGSLDEKGHIVELKVLGLGIKGDIGAAIAMEIGDAVYAPLHDFGGNVIALLSPDGQISESYEIDAFGKEILASPPLNPWRFASKRNEEGLVFFGLRFYDPSIGRWLTPDPSGFSDGPNLYAYLQNSPINRLDLFGLHSEDSFFSFKPMEFNMSIASLPINNQLFRCSVLEGGVFTDYLVSCGHWHELKFTPHEEQSGKFNLFNHPELGCSDGRIGFVTATHGINTKWDEFSDTCVSIVKQLPGTLFIGRYYGTEGILVDGLLACRDICNFETNEVITGLQFMISASNFVEKMNILPDSHGSKWAHFNHSRGGAIDLRTL